MTDERFDDPLASYRREARFALDDGEGPILREARENLSSVDLSPEITHELHELDTDAVDSIVQFEAIANYLITDNPAQPITKWWWHLGKLRSGSYPAELLPEHLRAVYRDAIAHQAA
ncbi:hypothetical protein [Methylomagnum sp.]